MKFERDGGLHAAHTFSKVKSYIYQSLVFATCHEQALKSLTRANVARTNDLHDAVNAAASIRNIAT